MNSFQEVYTYRAGRKLSLRKRPDQFVVRALPEELNAIGITDAQQLSSNSSRVTCQPQALEPLMDKARSLAPAFHDYEITETGEAFLITDRILVTFKETLSDAQIGEFAGQYGLILREQFSDRDFLFQLTEHTGINPVKLVVKLTETEPLVSIVDHDLNTLGQPYNITLPTDPAYRQQWHLHDQSSSFNFDRRASSNCEKAWQLLGNFGSEEVVIGVTDDGCKIDHPDFNSPNKFASWGYFVGTRLITQADISANPNQMYETGSDHGTACAGVIAAEIDASLTVGAAPGCRLLPIKWESDGSSLFISDSKLLTALNYLADKVDVMSNSWGRTPVSTWSTLVTRRVTELTQSGGRRGKGIVFLWAAGNENCPVDHVASLEVPYTTGWDFRSNGSQVWVGVQTTRYFRNNLANIPGVMHIAAITSLAQRSHYSNYGKGVTLCAPSNNVHAYYRLPVRGLGVTTTSGMGGLYTNQFGGTSSATPLVAGIAGLVISVNPELTALEVVSILKQTASKDLNFESYGRTPKASYDPNPTWDVSPIAPFDKGDFQPGDDPDGTWSPWFGHGKVDALAAVTEALARRPAQDPEEGNKTLTYQSAPAQAIPDNNTQGITDHLVVAETGNLQDISVSIAITHTWIGDLSVQLVSPDGTTVALHNRTGSSQDNLQVTYTPETMPVLANLKNRSIQGPWQLQVRDLAARDVGKLESWELKLTTGSNAFEVEDAEGAEIPDFNTQGIVRSQTLPEGLIIQSIEVFADVTHPNIGDLRISLVTPQGVPVTLHNQTGGGLDNLSRTWSDRDTLSLKALLGKPAGGTWQFRVADLTSYNKGKLNRWRMAVKG